MRWKLWKEIVVSVIDNLIELEMDARKKILGSQSGNWLMTQSGGYRVYYTDVGYVRCELSFTKDDKIRTTWRLNEKRISYSKLRELFKKGNNHD